MVQRFCEFFETLEVTFKHEDIKMIQGFGNSVTLIRNILPRKLVGVP